MSFADSGATLFDFDKSVVLVGEEVSAAARVVLAAVVAGWQRLGGDPMLVVLGDTAPFDLAGCNGLTSVPADAGDEKSLARWLVAELQRSRPWIDVVMALRAPDWATQVLADRLRRNGEPWPAWVVATEGESRLKVDQLLEGDFEKVLVEAHRRAQGQRSRIL